MTGHSEPQSMSGRSRPSVRVAKNHNPMTRMIAPTMSEAFRPLSDGGGRHPADGGGGGALAPHEGVASGWDGGGGVAGDGGVGAAAGGVALDPSALEGVSIGVRVVSESVTKPIVRGPVGPGQRRATGTAQ